MYKRQVEEPAAAGEILDAFFEEYGMSEKAAEPPVVRNQFTRGHFKRGVESVSYTHLDVYKRQAQKFSL